MTIINATSHGIHIYRKEDCEYNKSQRKWFVKKGAKPFLTIAPSRRLLNVHIENLLSYFTDEDVPVFISKVVAVDHPASQFPQIKTGDILVVSREYASVAVKRYPEFRYAVISQPVYNDLDNPRPIGCLGLEIVS